MQRTQAALGRRRSTRTHAGLQARGADLMRQFYGSLSQHEKIFQYVNQTEVAAVFLAN